MKRKTGAKKSIKVVYEQVRGVSKEETQRRIDKAFDVFFTAIVRAIKVNRSRSQENNNIKQA